MPAIKAEEVKRDCAQAGACGSVSTLKMGNQPRYSAIHRDSSMACGRNNNKPQAP